MRAGAALVAALGSAGCATLPPLAAGGGWRTTHVLSDGTETTPGERTLASGFAVEARSYPSLTEDLANERFYVGAEESLGTELGTGCCDLWRVGAFSGFVVTPVRPAGRWLGWEVTVPVLTLGRVPVRDDIPTAVGAGARTAVLWKLPFWRDECDLHSLVSYRTFVVGEVGLTGFVPLQGSEIRMQTEAVGTLGLRIDVSVLP